MTHVTQQAIAKAARASRTAVSLVLSGQAEAYGIRESTRQRILHACRQLGYSPNFQARSLRARRTGIIAVVGGVFQTPIRQYRQDLIAQYFKDRGYRVMLQDFHWSNDRVEMIRQLEEHRLEGMIVGEAEPPELVECLRAIRDRGVPVVLADGPVTEDFDQVRIDRRGAARLAVLHLVEQGYRDIRAALHPDHPYWAVDERRQGFAEGLMESGLGPVGVDRYLWAGDRRQWGDDYRAGYQTGELLIGASRSRPIGVYAIGDRVAVGMERALLDRGIAIPDEVGVVGTENLPESEYAAVPLSSMEYAVDRLAERVGEILLDRLAGTGPAGLVRESFEPRLVVRASSIRAPRVNEKEARR